MQNNEFNSSGSQDSGSGGPNRSTPWILTGAILIGLAGAGYGVYSSSEAARTVESQQATYKADMTRMQQDMQMQVRVLQDRLASQENKERETAAAQAPRDAAQTAGSRKTTARRASAQRAARQPVEDPRIKQLEQKVSDQNEKIADTQRMLDSTRSDLEGRISSTSDELHGSIARTSEEVAALRRRGERDYFEFDVNKSKALRRVGPLNLALRRADTRHKRFNLDLMVDDNKLEKKNVNLYEPVYITSPEWPTPVELVVNQVDKDHVRGYVSTPKYKKSELAATSAAERNKLTPKPDSEKSQ